MVARHPGYIMPIAVLEHGLKMCSGIGAHFEHPYITAFLHNFRAHKRVA